MRTPRGSQGCSATQGGLCSRSPARSSPGSLRRDPPRDRGLFRPYLVLPGAAIVAGVFIWVTSPRAEGDLEPTGGWLFGHVERSEGLEIPRVGEGIANLDNALLASIAAKHPGNLDRTLG